MSYGHKCADKSGIPERQKTMTGASVNFKAVKSAGHAVSHASREVAPTYLLPSDKSMGTVVLLDDKGKVSQVLDAKMALASPRAKVDQRYSPVWEGILNLRRPEPGEDAEEYRAECSAVVTDWYKQYEAATGHKVLRVDVHLDEGHMVDGEAVLNAHAHVIADRTNDLGRVIKLSPKQLRELQTMTAEVTQLERGKSSFETGRKHISHQAYKHLAEQGRLETQQVKVKLDKSQSDLSRQRKLSKEWSDADLAKVKDLEAKLDGEPARLADALKAQEVQLNEKYRLDRERMKQENTDALAAGLAKMYSQKDYQDLKTKHAEALADLKTELARAAQQAVKVPSLEAQATGLRAEITQLAPLAAQVPDLKTKLAEAQATAAQVPGLEMTLKATSEQVKKMDEYTKTLNGKLADADRKIATELIAKAEAIEALVLSGEKSNALLKTANGHRAEAEKLTSKVADLKTKLATAQQQAGKVPELEAAVTSQAAAFDKLKADATAVITPLRTEVKSMKNQIAQLEADKAELAATTAKWAAKAQEYQAAKAAGTPAHLIVPGKTPAPIPREATKTAQEAPKVSTHPTPPPTPTKSLKEALKESWEAMLDWIKGVGVHVPIDTSLNQTHSGAVKHLDDLHAVQHKGQGRYAIHRLADLDKVPGLDDPKMEIRYTDGKGTVEGRLGKSGVGR